MLQVQLVCLVHACCNVLVISQADTPAAIETAVLPMCCKVYLWNITDCQWHWYKQHLHMVVCMYIDIARKSWSNGLTINIHTINDIEAVWVYVTSPKSHVPATCCGLVIHGQWHSLNWHCSTLLRQRAIWVPMCTYVFGSSACALMLSDLHKTTTQDKLNSLQF